jgi:hypothetical protein
LELVNFKQSFINSYGIQKYLNDKFCPRILALIV